jgi:hypothetical protein
VWSKWIPNGFRTGSNSMNLESVKEKLYTNLATYLDTLDIGDESAIDTIVIGVCDVIDETFEEIQL